MPVPQQSDQDAGFCCKALGLVLKEKNRKWSLLTELGKLHLQRDYYYDNRSGCYVCPLDDVLGIRKYERIGDNGSCTEGQASHVLSERFSRDPIGWSEESLGKLSQARVYIKNGGKLKDEDFGPKDKDGEARKERYSEYADRMLKEAVEGCFDWSIFEKPIVPFGGASGTQTLIRGLGQAQNTLFC